GKTSYFNNIGISMKKNPLLKEKIAMIDSKLGFLFKTDIPELLKYLANLFPLEDMVKFGILNNALDKTPYSFRQSVEEGLIVIPNFDMHTNMCTGIKYRKTKLKSWVDKNTKETVRDTNKEPEFSYKRIANPLPYYLTREALLNKFITFRFFEGQKDLHSMPLKDGVCDVAIPGVNGISEEMLGLFRGRLVELFYDQDKAGQDGAMKIKLLLEKAGAYVINHTWDINLGADINDVLQAGNISKI
ncbi:MAG: hypothetical protein U9P72_08310, partial [Campylobacterota bacterium]|nr:hypothetical protein [Campylobacterota bacterium]